MNRIIRTLCFATLAAMTMGACYCRNPAEGEKVGQIVSVKREGLICKTWEVQIMRGGLQDGSGAIGTAFYFTIESEDMARTARDLMGKQAEVLLTYRTEGISSLCRSEGSSAGDFAVSIVPTKPARDSAPPRVKVP